MSLSPCCCQSLSPRRQARRCLSVCSGSARSPATSVSSKSTYISNRRRRNQPRAHMLCNSPQCPRERCWGSDACITSDCEREWRCARRYTGQLDLYATTRLVLWVVCDWEWILAVLLLRECERLLRDRDLAAVGRDDLRKSRKPKQREACQSSPMRSDSVIAMKTALTNRSSRRDFHTAAVSQSPQICNSRYDQREGHVQQSKSSVSVRSMCTERPVAAVYAASCASAAHTYAQTHETGHCGSMRQIDKAWHSFRHCFLDLECGEMSARTDPVSCREYLLLFDEAAAVAMVMMGVSPLGGQVMSNRKSPRAG